MGKVSNIHKLVPCRSSCKRLSKKEFNHTAMVWFKVPADNFTPEFWVLDSREKFESLHIDLSKEIYYPAPTAQEFTEKMQDCFMRVEGSNLGDYLAQWVKSDSRSYWGHGKTPVIALYNCYMDYYRRNNGK